MRIPKITQHSAAEQGRRAVGATERTIRQTACRLLPHHPANKQANSHINQPHQPAIASSHTHASVTSGLSRKSCMCYPAASYPTHVCMYVAICMYEKQAGKQQAGQHYQQISSTNKQVGSNIHQAIRQAATASSHSKQLQQAATSVTSSLSRQSCVCHPVASYPTNVCMQPSISHPHQSATHSKHSHTYSKQPHQPCQPQPLQVAPASIHSNQPPQAATSASYIRHPAASCHQACAVTSRRGQPLFLLCWDLRRKSLILSGLKPN
jgi:hypothetical protein